MSIQGRGGPPLSYWKIIFSSLDWCPVSVSHGWIWILFKDSRPVRTDTRSHRLFCVCVRFSILGWGPPADVTRTCAQVSQLKAVCKVYSEFNFPELLNSLQMWNFIYLFLKDWQPGQRIRKLSSSDFNQRLVRYCQRTVCCADILITLVFIPLELVCFVLWR